MSWTRLPRAGSTGSALAHAVACPRSRSEVTGLATDKWAARVSSLSVLMAWNLTAPVRVPGLHREPNHQGVERGDYAQQAKGNGDVAHDRTDDLVPQVGRISGHALEAD